MNQQPITIVIATIHPWNIRRAKSLRLKGVKFVVINHPKQLTITRLSKINPQYVFFPHWSWKIPKDIFENFMCVIFHMTDLPYGRGGSPLQNLIIQGHKRTKISALRASEQMDAGDIFLKRSLSLQGCAQDIYERAAEIIFNDMIPSIMTQKPMAKPQKGKVVSFRRRSPSDGNLAKVATLQEVYDYIRMLDAQGYPQAFLETPSFCFQFKNAQQLRHSVRATVEITIK